MHHQKMSLGAGTLQVDGARQQFWHREGGYPWAPSNQSIELLTKTQYLPMGGWNAKKDLLNLQAIAKDPFSRPASKITRYPC